MLKIYTDGACAGNPGPGGWGVVMIWGNVPPKELSGFAPETTNNRMELQAAIEGLSAIKRNVPITLYSDSSYIVNAVNNKWLDNWQSNGWKTADKKPIKNQDLWEKLIELNVKWKPTYVWVKGHANDKWNNRADALAVAEVDKKRKQLLE